MTPPPDDYDSPWKDILEHAFPEFMAFYFPEASAQIEVQGRRDADFAPRMPSGKMKLVQAWLEIHRDAIMADWGLAVQGVPPQRIRPLE